MVEKVYCDEWVEIIQDDGIYSLRSLKMGMAFDAFNQIIHFQLRHLKITSFMAIRNVLGNAPAGPVPFAVARERVVIRVSEDDFKAWFSLYVPPAELGETGRAKLAGEVFTALQKAGVIFGIRSAVLTGHLDIGDEYLIAEGLMPTHGDDAVIRMIEPVIPKPQVIENGNANYYEMNLIHPIQAGDWLGERVEPKLGMPGKTVLGKEIPPLEGRSKPLKYDRKSVREETVNGITTLYATKTGALNYKGEQVGVYDFLEIQGNVDYNTGNVQFDGYLSVKGLIEDGFSVTASRDVQILGHMGVGDAEMIESRDGNIYITGGIAGKGRARIRCRKNLYVKFLSNVEIECDGTVYIGFYSYNSVIRARQVVVESPKGRITGGSIEADIRVEAAELGNRAENRTIVRVHGFDRKQLQETFEGERANLEESRARMVRCKQLLSVYTANPRLTDEQKVQMENIRNEMDELREGLKDTEFRIRNLAEYLKTPGEGAVIVRSRIYGKVRVEIKQSFEECTSEGPGITWYARSGDMVRK